MKSQSSSKILTYFLSLVFVLSLLVVGIPAAEASDTNLREHSGRVGDIISITLTGATTGSVWGSDVYTDDSSLDVAAVHAGVVKVGETKTVRVMILAGQNAYQGSSRNGVTTESYEEWERSFKFLDTDQTSTQVQPDSKPVATGQNLVDYRDRVGQTVSLTVTGLTTETVWGSDIYTDDSSVATAAVHAGVLKVGETKTVRVMILAGQNAYQGSSRNGVSTDSWDQWDGSYKFVDSTDQISTPVQPDSKPVATGQNLVDYRDRVGQTVSLTVTGLTTETVWGSDIYTDDSSVATAAVHAGVLKVGETKTVRVMILAGQNAYQGSSRNGVSTDSWDQWDGSFKFVDSTPQVGTQTQQTSHESFASGEIMSWSPVQGIGYRLFRSTSDSELGISVTDFYLTSTTYADVNVEPNKTYYYKVKPVLAEAQPLQGKEEVLGDIIAAYTVTTGANIATPSKQMSFLILQIDNPYMNVNGISREIDPGRGTTPIVISGRSMVPIRSIVEAIGGKVEYDAGTKNIILNARGNVVSMWVGRNDVTVNGANRKMDVTPVVLNGRTYVPVRFAAENLNTKVDWINSSKEAVIIYE